VPLLCCREIPVPGSMRRVIRAMVHYSDPPSAEARLSGATQELRSGSARSVSSRPTPAVSHNGRWTVTCAEKLARIPGYQAGVPIGQAPEAIAAGGNRPALPR
jgi:hypothetical protein